MIADTSPLLTSRWERSITRFNSFRMFLRSYLEKSGSCCLFWQCSITFNVLKLYFLTISESASKRTEELKNLTHKHRNFNEGARAFEQDAAIDTYAQVSISCWKWTVCSYFISLSPVFYKISSSSIISSIEKLWLIQASAGISTNMA